jgi:Na+-transporting NADH:ubiquinone oxidoreductase subunit C
MKRGYTYTIIFILVVSAVFTLFLAGIDVLMKPKITANARLEEQKSILNAFNVDDEGTAEEINLRFNDLVKADEMSEMLFYSHQDSSGQTLGYAVPFTGSGLWGTIRGWIAVNPEMNQLQGIVFTEQNETPGLGGRIMEEWFREQFRGLELVQGEQVKYGEGGSQKIDAISGATQTSNAILRIINQVKDEILPQMEVK